MFSPNVILKYPGAGAGAMKATEAMEDRIARHLIDETATVREVMARLDRLAVDSVLFLVNTDNRISATVTDGDVRRYLLAGGDVDAPAREAAYTNFRFLDSDVVDLEKLRAFRNANLRILPVLDPDGVVTDIVNFRVQRSRLPLDAIIMAGGVGSRLRPLTDNVPKPLLPVGDKPIIEHNVDRLKAFGITRLTLSIKYLGEQLVDYFGDGRSKGMNISYVTEDEPRGTIGAVSEVKEIHNDYVLVMNSDLLTTIDFEEMFAQAIAQNADMAVATVPYEVKVPYGVIETEGELVTGLAEKPTYTYYSNAGIYIIRREHLAKVPSSGKFGAPDLMKVLYDGGYRVVHYPIVGYWLDIGKHRDYEKAQQDIKQLSL